MKTVFLRVIEADDKAAALQSAIREAEVAQGKHRFDVDTAGFVAVPRSPFAYWITPKLVSIFQEFPVLEGQLGSVKGGVITYDDFRFVRLCSEAEAFSVQRQDWTNLNKGGRSSKFFFSFYLLINWRQNARELRAYY